MDENSGQFKADPNGALYGLTLALHGAIRALIQTHPDPVAYQQAFHREWKDALAILNRGRPSDVALAVFRETSLTLDPVAENGWKPGK